jgi:hypothetical protein
VARIAIGPQRPTPSWSWVGKELGDELAKNHAVGFFDAFDPVPEADVILAVKQRPSLAFVQSAHRRGARVAFAPIDIYQDVGEIDADHDMLAACDLVLLHAADLEPFVSVHTSHVLDVDHHLRFALEPMAAFREEGFVLWVGATQNLIPFLAWFERNPLPYEVRLLTNISREHWVLAKLTAHRLGLRIRFDEDRINGLPVYQWSEARQEEMMRTCRAAIDIKGTDFAQATKPPTKAQQFIGSGIPFACNADSPMARHFAKRGFEIARPHDTGRLFSKDYWNETQDLARRLRTELSLPAVANRFSRAFDLLMAASKKIAP